MTKNCFTLLFSDIIDLNVLKINIYTYKFVLDPGKYKSSKYYEIPYAKNRPGQTSKTVLP